MIPFRFFNIRHHIDAIKHFEEDPAKEAYGYIQGVFLKYTQGYILTVIVILILLGVSGFSSSLGGPHALAEIFFYIVLFFTIVASVIVFFIWRKIQRYVESLSEKYKKMRAQETDYSYPEETNFLDE